MVTIGSLLLSLALLVLVGLFVLRPLLLEPKDEATPLTPRQALLAQKEALVEQIRSLDFDRETGTVPEEEYQRQRSQLAAETAALLRKLDELAPTAGDEAMLDEIEAAVARRRGQPVADAALVTDDLEAAVARRRRPATAAQAKGAASPEVAVAARSNGRAFCPQCGEAHDRGDKFCAYCGHHLA